jgi:hypothetical protein
MFGIRREQGRLPELAPSSAARLAVARWRLAAGLAAVFAELGMESEARRELDAILAEGLGACARRSGSARSSTSPTRARRCGRALRGGALPGARALRGLERDDRPSRRLLRRDGPLPRHDGGGARRVGPRRGALPRRASRSTRGSARGRGSRTPRTRTRGCSSPRQARRRGARPAQLGVAIGLAQTIGLPALLRRRRSSARAPSRPRPSPARRASARELEILVELGPRPLEPRDRAAAPHQRAHRGEPRPLDPRKTGCANRTEAAGYALRRGLVPSEVSP